MSQPNILNAATNVQKMLRNISYILDTNAQNAIREEINKQVFELFKLGESHCLFAVKIKSLRGFDEEIVWRQRISRLYYGIYNVRRAIMLACEGTYSTSSDDHQKVENLPDGMNNVAMYKRRIRDLRADRNLADYDHLASIDKLTQTPDDAEILVLEFIKDARNFLNERGILV